MAEYVDEFNKLARYAPNDVNTDAARQEKFLEGLNDELGVQLTMATFANCQELIDRAILLEGKHHAIENRKSKYKNNNDKYNSGVQQKPRTTSTYPDVHNEQGKHNGHGYNSNGGDANQPHNPSTHRRDMSKVVRSEA